MSFWFEGMRRHVHWTLQDSSDFNDPIPTAWKTLSPGSASYKPQKVQTVHNLAVGKRNLVWRFRSPLDQ